MFVRMIETGKNFSIWFSLCFMLFVIVYSLIRNEYRGQKLENTLESKALLVKYSNGTAKHGKRGYFQYFVGKRKFNFIEEGDFSGIKIGDTVEIIYSVENNSVAKVVRKK